MAYIVVILIGAFFYIKLKNQEKSYNTLIGKMLDSFNNSTPLENIPQIINGKYEEHFVLLKQQEQELALSMNELREYRNELEITYNALVTKSTQLEYSNQALEKRVANLSNLNALARTVLSVLDLEKTVDIILDAYFVLTGAKRVSLYLWEGEKLRVIKTKGVMTFRGEVQYPEEVLKNFTKNDYTKVYEDLSRGFRLEENETVIASPMVVKGKQLGVIFIIEDKDRLIELDEETILALVIQVSIAINNAKIYSDLLEKERISKELEVASRMQKKIIPKDMTNVFGLDIANYFEPAREIGGDFYDYYIYNDETFYLTIADVSGKGVPAAFLMALARSILRTLSTNGITPRENLDALNKIIYSDIAENMFITVMHCRYDYNTKILSYSNAGHNPMVVYRAASDSIELHAVKGVAIGFIKNYGYRQSELKLEKGDVVVLYTDGITEAENQRKELFGMDKLKETIYKNRYEDAETIKKKLLIVLEDFTEEQEQSDDLTFVILKNNE
ncbi:MAG: GAF domain-containing SpoIIE family protein phosphatase [Fusobacteriaceae bacterium]